MFFIFGARKFITTILCEGVRLRGRGQPAGHFGNSYPFVFVWCLSLGPYFETTNQLVVSKTLVGHVRSHSEFGCEFWDTGRNPLTVDFKLRGSLDLMLVLGSGCSQQAFAFGVAGCPQKSSVQQCQSAPKFAIHVGPKT